MKMLNKGAISFFLQWDFFRNGGSNKLEFIGMEDPIENYGNLPPCKDLPSAGNTLDQLAKMYVESEPWMRACPLPCQQTFYTMKTKQFHQVRF